MENRKGHALARTSEITLGFVGSGKVEKKNVNALLRDLIDASGGSAKFILPMTRTYWNPNLALIAAFAVEQGIPFEAIVDESTAKMRDLKEYLGTARRQHQAAAAAVKLATLLEGAREASLIVLWNDEDEDALDAVRAADEKNVPLLELTRGLDRIELTDDEAEDDDEEVEHDEDDEDVEPESDEVDDEDEEEAATPGEDDPYTQAELEAMDRKELVAVAGDFGVATVKRQPANIIKDILAAQDEPDPEEEEEFDEVEAEDDLEAAAEDEDEQEDEDEEDEYAPDAEEEEFVAPDEPDDTTLLADGPMTEFEAQLLSILQDISASLAVNAGRAATPAMATESKAVAKEVMAEVLKAPAKPARARKPAPAPEPEEEEEEAPAPVRRAKRTAPAPSAPPAKRSVRRPAAKEETNGSMSKAAAQKVLDSYRPRRGRPPAEVTEARKVLGLA